MPASARNSCVVIDASGDVVLSRKVVNDEASLLGLIGEVLGLAQGGRGVLGEATWPMGARLARLGAQGQEVLSLSGRLVHHAAATYRGDGKTDAKDARIIADQARMRSDLQPAVVPDEVAVSVRLQASHRLDVVHDQVSRRSTNSGRSTGFARS